MEKNKASRFSSINRLQNKTRISYQGVSEDRFRNENGGREISSFSLGMLISSGIAFFAFILLAIVAAAALHNGDDFGSRPDRKTKIIKNDQTWYIPDDIDDGGRSFITMTGGGGGGCNGGATISGGGGNSGVSIVNYPVLLKKGYKCRFDLGVGGDFNQDGTSTFVQCFDGDGIIKFEMTLEGGRNGCGYLPSEHRGSNIYPFTHELFGANNMNNTIAQNHPYGGRGGLGNSGGAGSVFGNGGTNEEFTPDDDDDEPARGAGGYGGLSGFGSPSRGGHGKIFIMYYTK